MKILGRIVKWLMLIITAVILIAFGVRMYLGQEPAAVKEFITSGGADKGAETVKNTGSSEKYSDGGLFFVTRTEYQEKAGEWQFVVRYNHSLLRGIAEKLETTVEALPEEPFRYVLADSDGNIFEAYATVPADGVLQDFVRVAFSGVDISGEKSLTLRVYYTGDYPEESTGLFGEGIDEKYGPLCGEIMVWGYYYGA